MAKYDAVKRQWGSFEPPTNNNAKKLSLGQRILELLSKYGPKVAQINDDTGVQITYDELHLQTIRAAQNLQRMGFGPRQKFSFMAMNCDELVPIFLAATCLACPIVPFFGSLSANEIINILRKTKPTAMFCDADSYQKSIKTILVELDWKIKVFTFGKRIDDDIEPVSNLLIETGNEHDFVPIQIDVEADIAGVLCSSGTTGTSKGIILAYNSSVYNILYSDFYKYKPDSVSLDIHSIYWTVGILIIMQSIYHGCVRIISTQSMTAKRQLELIEKYKVNILNPTPGNLVHWVKYEHIHEMDLSSVKNMFIHGGKSSLSFIPDIKRHFPNAHIVECFGITEIGLISLALLDNLNENGGGHRLAPNNIVKIVDDNGSRCGPNEIGEIRVKKPNKFRGYINDPVQTANAVDDEGFFQTGDIGQFNDQGFLFITDRKKNIFSVFYYRNMILPQEIEECLEKLPDIKDVCVIGIPIVSQYFLPAVVAVRMPGSKLSKRDIFNAIAENFPDRAKPRGGVYFVEELTKNHNGKVIRREITKLAAQQFRLARENDAELQSYLADIPEEYRAIIYKYDETF